MKLSDYDKLIQLDKQFVPNTDGSWYKLQAVDNALAWMTSQKHDVNKSYSEKRKLLQSLLTTRSPEDQLPASIISEIDSLLQAELNEKLFTDSKSLKSINESFLTPTYPALKFTALWKGDITTLKIDAIVNAANSEMLGCFQPFHTCIDNAIHAGAGPQLRDDCYKIMQQQGTNEKTGDAKLTRAYNLPSNFVIHTVGPIVSNKIPSSIDKKQLADCYTSCLDLATESNCIRSLAFCSISTGIFGYPVDEAAQIALQTVSDWISKKPRAMDLIVFNVFSDHDESIYRRILNEGQHGH